MEIEQAVNKRKKITRLLLILLIILLSLVFIKYLISKSNKYISENGKSSMGAVVEQIQQTYDLQVSGYYSQLQLVEEFLLHERELSLEMGKRIGKYSYIPSGKWSGNISRWNKNAD